MVSAPHPKRPRVLRVPREARFSAPAPLPLEYFYKSGDNKIVLNRDGIKCAGDTSNCREISDGDEINIPEFNGDFTVSIHPFDAPRYLPNVI